MRRHTLVSLIFLLLPFPGRGRVATDQHYERTEVQIDASTADVDASFEKCFEVLEKASERQGDVLDSQIAFAIHRNGEPDPCSRQSIPSSLDSMKIVMSSLSDCRFVSKYQFDAFMTQYFGNELNPLGDDCNGTKNTELSGFFGYCDMGPEHTVIHKDHNRLVRVSSSGSLPCHWYTREGKRIKSYHELAAVAAFARDNYEPECESNEGDETCQTSLPTLHLYAVPAGRVFMFAPKYVGETFVLDHVLDSEENKVILEVLSVDPRVFDIFHFFNMNESNALIEKALAETSETHRFHRSTTGTASVNVFSKRTSENAWDTHGKVAQIIKRRCFSLLGFDHYDEAYADGLQILRYNQTTAYTPHLDYLDDRSGREAYNYETAGKGGNRFATILLYFTDLPEGSGGETVFTKAWPPGLPVHERIQNGDMVRMLRESGEISMLKEGSWEEEMVADCRTKLAVRPYATRAVLFYSQFPDGSLDHKSFHGGCPVLNGTKLAANLWTWSAPRPEFDGAPLKRERKPRERKGAHVEISAIFRNSKENPDFKDAQLYYNEDGFFGNLGFEDPPISVNTYEGHVWNVKDRKTNKILTTFTIGSKEKQEFVV